jgi:hypothetical protein
VPAIDGKRLVNVSERGKIEACIMPVDKRPILIHRDEGFTPINRQSFE